MVNLTTTNVLLGIMAGVSLLEALVIVGIGVAGWKVYRQVTEMMAAIERRHVDPAMARVNAILDDVKAVSETVKAETERVDQAIHKTMDRVDDTAVRLKKGVRVGASPLVGFVRGLRTGIEHFNRLRHRPATSGTSDGLDGV